MGLFSKMKGALSSKANAALDRAIDPGKELELKIQELEAGKQAAMKELLTYKATAKTMEQEMARLAERAKTYEGRAMQAVKAGDDELARRCLKEKKDAEVELAKVTRDRDEMAGHAIQLNRSRKELETKLQILKLKKGTLKTQLAAARSASGNPLGVDGALFDKMDEAEARIDAEANLAEVEAAMGADAAVEGELDRKLLAAEAEHGAAGGDDALGALKARMKADAEAKKLKP